MYAKKKKKKKLQKLQIHDSGNEFAGPNFGATDA